MGRGSRGVPGGVLLHPLPIAAALLIIVNDLWLKPLWPGFWSGKLSDVGICFLLPVALVAAAEWLVWVGVWITGRDWTLPVTGTAAVASITAAAYFALLQLSPAWVELHRHLIATVGRISPAPVTRDPTDLICLLFCAAAYFYLCRR